MSTDQLTETTFRTVIQAAIRAPSMHNSQPWLFRLQDGAIDVHADPTRRLPARPAEVCGWRAGRPRSTPGSAWPRSAMAPKRCCFPIHRSLTCWSGWYRLATARKVGQTAACTRRSPSGTATGPAGDACGVGGGGPEPCRRCTGQRGRAKAPSRRICCPAGRSTGTRGRATTTSSPSRWSRSWAPLVTPSATRSPPDSRCSGCSSRSPMAAWPPPCCPNQSR